MILEITFIVLCIIACLGGFFVPDSSPYAHRGRYGLLLVLIIILGLVVFNGGHTGIYVR